MLILYMNRMNSRKFRSNLSWSFARSVLSFPVIVCASAMALSLVYASVAVRLNLHLIPENFLPLVIGIAGAVAGPATVFAVYREYQNYTGRLALEAFATTDPLTGVLNRRAFMDMVAEEQSRMQRTGKTAAIILFDLDHFKKLNDQYGHATGDEVLKSVSGIAYSELRGPFDRLGRWGGEEFIVLLHEVTLKQARGVAERMRHRIHSHEQSCNGVQQTVSASFGVSLLRSDCIVNTVISRADRAMYEAKACGRNLVMDGTAHELVAA